MSLLTPFTRRAHLGTASTTTIGFSATGLTHRPIKLASASGRIASLTAAPSAVTISGGAGTKYLYAQLAAPSGSDYPTRLAAILSAPVPTNAPDYVSAIQTFLTGDGTLGIAGLLSSVTLVMTTSATPPDTHHVPLGECEWDGAAITSVTSYELEVGASVTSAVRETFRGLHLRTHPDFDKAASTVQLIACDEIVFDGGARVTTGLAGLTMDLSVSGAGGRDASANETASCWYRVYAIWKTADGSVALLGVPTAHQQFLNQDTSAGEDGSHVLRRATGPVNTKLGQGIKITGTSPVPYVDLKLIRAGAVSGHVWITLETDSGGVPSGTVLATSDKLDASVISTTAHFVRFPIRSTGLLTLDTQYHVVLQGSYAASDTVNIAWRADTTASIYGNGSKASWDGATWTADTDDDFVLKVYTHTFINWGVTLPSGYSQKCLLGYVRNDGSSNLIPAVLTQRRCCYLTTRSSLGAQTATVPQLVDLATGVPPVPTRISLVGQNSGAGNLTIAAPVPDGYGATTSSMGQGGSVWIHAPAASGVATLAEFITEKDGVYCFVGAGTGNFYVTGWEW